MSDTKEGLRFRRDVSSETFLIASVPESGHGAVLEENNEASLVGSHFLDGLCPRKRHWIVAGFTVLIRCILGNATPTRRLSAIRLDVL